MKLRMIGVKADASQTTGNVNTTISDANYGGLNAGQVNAGSGTMSFVYNVKASDLTLTVPF